MQGLGAGDDDEGSGWFAGNPEGEVPEVPEPTTFLLMGGSLLAFAFYRKRNSGRN